MPFTFNPFTGTFDAIGPSKQFNGNVVPTGTLPGTSFTVPQLGGQNPSLILVVLNGLVLDRVTTPVNVDEFSLVGQTITTARTITSADKFKAFLWY